MEKSFDCGYSSYNNTLTGMNNLNYNDNWIKYEINQTFNCDTDFYASNILE